MQPGCTQRGAQAFGKVPPIIDQRQIIRAGLTVGQSLKGGQHLRGAGDIGDGFARLNRQRLRHICHAGLAFQRAGSGRQQTGKKHGGQ